MMAEGRRELDAGVLRWARGQRKGRFGDLLAQLPIHVIVKRAALIGPASYAFALMLTESEGGSLG